MGLGRKSFLAWCTTGLATATQLFPENQKEKEEPKRLPDGTLQSDAILKAEYKKALADAARLIELGQEVEEELKKNQQHVLSLGMIKRLEEIEKLARKMRGRISR